MRALSRRRPELPARPLALPAAAAATSAGGAEKNFSSVKSSYLIDSGPNHSILLSRSRIAPVPSVDRTGERIYFRARTTEPLHADRLIFGRRHGGRVFPGLPGAGFREPCPVNRSGAVFSADSRHRPATNDLRRPGICVASQMTARRRAVADRQFPDNPQWPNNLNYCVISGIYVFLPPWHQTCICSVDVRFIFNDGFRGMADLGSTPPFGRPRGRPGPGGITSPGCHFSTISPRFCGFC